MCVPLCAARETCPTKMFSVFHDTSKPENRQSIAPEVFNRFAEDAQSQVPVKQISLPDLSVPLQLGRREPFSLFIPKHRKLAARLIDIFLGLCF